MPAVGTSPYDSAEQILELARTMANDAALSIAGDILADSQPYVFTMLQGCYEDLQDRLAAEGANTYKKYAIVTGLTAVASPGGLADPTIQVQLMYTGYNDGVTNHAAPTLPADMLEPLEVWERQNGTIQRWREVQQASDSINQSTRTPTFGTWDWESDILYLPGATQSNDLKFKYIPYMPTLTTGTSPVIYAKCKNALAALMVKAAALSRGGNEIAAAYEIEAQNFIKNMVNRQSTKEQYGTSVRRPFRSHGARR